MQSARGIAILAGAGVSALGVATTVAALRSDLPVAPTPAVAAADLASGVSFALVGTLLWIRYPRSRMGALAVLVGLASFLADLRWFTTDFTWTLGAVMTDAHLLVLAWAVLAFPAGRLRPPERAFVVGAVAYYLALNIAGNLFESPSPGCVECPDSLLLIRVDSVLNDRIWEIGQVVNLAVLGTLVAMIARKWSRATVPARRALAPVVWALGPIALALLAAFLEPLLGPSDRASIAVQIGERLALVAFPVALAVGMLRTDLARARVADLTRGLEHAADPNDLERLVRTALGDQAAGLAYWSTALDGLIDADGREVVVMPGQTITELTRGGEVVGAVIHDPSVDPALVEAVGAAAGLALHNQRLGAELRRQLTEVAASRERLAEATLAERQRLERNLHDGAQQRLLAIGALLGRARLKAMPEVSGLLDEAVDELRGTMDELREIARGVHPSILTERGLPAAVEALAERSPIPVTVSVDRLRCRPPVEAAAYFLVAEALANTIRHASASHASVTIRRDGDMLDIAVRDDGIGGADLMAGTGLQNLADRLAALGGGLDMTSPTGGGTQVRGWMPCG